MNPHPAHGPGSAQPPLAVFALTATMPVEVGAVPARPEVTAVPEPSPLFLLVGALALVFLVKRGGNNGGS